MCVLLQEEEVTESAEGGRVAIGGISLGGMHAFFASVLSMCYIDALSV